METTTIANHEVGSDSSESVSAVSSPASSLHVTRIGRELYKAAVKGNFETFKEVQNMKSLLTPNKNTVLHVHLTSRTTETTQSENVSRPLVRQIRGRFRDLIYKRTETTVSQQFVEQIIDKCGDLVLLPNAKGETLLHVAARYGHHSISELLIERANKAFPQDIENGIGADKKLIRATNQENNTALHEAVRYNHIKVVEILLEKDTEYSYCANDCDETPLYLASERQYKQMVRKMLDIMESPAYGGPNGRTALHAAVINRDIEMAKDLLENEHLRGTVKHADEKGWVPLHYAAKIGDKELAKLLLKQDENTAYMQDNDGRTALHIAAYCGHSFIMQKIIKYYPDCSELVDKKGWNVLHYAVNGEKMGVTPSIMRNLSLSNLYNEKDVDGNTPLHLLANSRFLSGGFVHNRRVDRLAMNKQHQTALDVAYAIDEDTGKVWKKQEFIWRLKRVGAIRSPRLDLKSKRDGQGEFQKLMFTKEARESHILVATLIATVSFAAGFTLPGGTIQEGEHKGSPILGQRASFKAFMVSNTLALVLAASAAFIHLFSPLNKAKWKDYYLSGVAFSFTLVAIATMIVAFATGTYAVLGSSSVGIAVITIGLSFFLVFRQVLKISFKGTSLLAFMKNLVNIIIFPFIRFPSRPFGFFILLFKSDQAERKTLF